MSQRPASRASVSGGARPRAGRGSGSTAGLGGGAPDIAAGLVLKQRDNTTIYDRFADTINTRVPS